MHAARVPMPSLPVVVGLLGRGHAPSLLGHTQCDGSGLPLGASMEHRKQCPLAVLPSMGQCRTGRGTCWLLFVAAGPLVFPPVSLPGQAEVHSCSSAALSLPCRVNGRVGALQLRCQQCLFLPLVYQRNATAGPCATEKQRPPLLVCLVVQYSTNCVCRSVWIGTSRTVKRNIFARALHQVHILNTAVAYCGFFADGRCVRCTAMPRAMNSWVAEAVLRDALGSIVNSGHMWLV